MKQHTFIIASLIGLATVACGDDDPGPTTSSTGGSSAGGSGTGGDSAGGTSSQGGSAQGGGAEGGGGSMGTGGSGAMPCTTNADANTAFALMDGAHDLVATGPLFGQDPTGYLIDGQTYTITVSAADMSIHYPTEQGDFTLVWTCDIGQTISGNPNDPTNPSAGISIVSADPDDAGGRMNYASGAVANGSFNIPGSAATGYNLSPP